MSDHHEVPSNCLVLPQRDGYRVEFEAEASKVDDGYKVWISLFDEGAVVHEEVGEIPLTARAVIVPSLDQFTIKGVALGFAAAWEAHI